MVSECGKLTQAVEAKKVKLLGQIKMECKAKLKALQLQKDHLEMMATCASHMASTCARLAQCKQVSFASSLECGCWDVACWIA